MFHPSDYFLVPMHQRTGDSVLSSLFSEFPFGPSWTDLGDWDEYDETFCRTHDPRCRDIMKSGKYGKRRGRDFPIKEWTHGAAGQLKVDCKENGELELRMAVPGVRLEDIKVELDPDFEGSQQLVLTINKNEDHHQESKYGLRMTRRSAFNVRTVIPLHCSHIDSDKIEANLLDDNLVINIPLPEDFKRKSTRINVRSKGAVGQEGERIGLEGSVKPETGYMEPHQMGQGRVGEEYGQYSSSGFTTKPMSGKQQVQTKETPIKK